MFKDFWFRVVPPKVPPKPKVYQDIDTSKCVGEPCAPSSRFYNESYVYFKCKVCDVQTKAHGYTGCAGKEEAIRKAKDSWEKGEK